MIEVFHFLTSPCSENLFGTICNGIFFYCVCDDYPFVLWKLYCECERFMFVFINVCFYYALFFVVKGCFYWSSIPSSINCFLRNCCIYSFIFIFLTSSGFTNFSSTAVNSSRPTFLSVPSVSVIFLYRGYEESFLLLLNLLCSFHFLI